MKYFTQDFDALRVVNFFPQGNRNKLKHKTKLKSKELDRGVCYSTSISFKKTFKKKDAMKTFNVQASKLVMLQFQTLRFNIHGRFKDFSFRWMLSRF
jgi:hypothetical protein